MVLTLRHGHDTFEQVIIQFVRPDFLHVQWTDLRLLSTFVKSCTLTHLKFFDQIVYNTTRFKIEFLVLFLVTFTVMFFNSLSLRKDLFKPNDRIEHILLIQLIVVVLGRFVSEFFEFLREYFLSLWLEFFFNFLLHFLCKQFIFLILSQLGTTTTSIWLFVLIKSIIFVIGLFIGIFHFRVIHEVTFKII